VLARMDVAKDGCSCEPNVGLKVGLVVLEGDCGGKVDVSSSFVGRMSSSLSSSSFDGSKH